jgi:hypothetical protein
MSLSSVVFAWTLLQPVLEQSSATTASDNTREEELARLVGHRVEHLKSGYRIVDIAGEGAPLVGCVMREGKKLFFANDEARMQLVGPLAVPRIAGPNYKVWIIGEVSGTASNLQLKARRLGILAPPGTSGCTEST